MQQKRKVDRLFEHYGTSHTHAVNEALHWFCIPAIVMSLFGLLWSIPLPDFFPGARGIIPLNAATLFMGFTLVYYFRLSVPLALGMVGVALLLCAAGWLLHRALPLPLWQSSLLLFVAAWIGQFIGHKIEGKKPSFLEDIQYLLIGPFWLLSKIYRRLGISY